MTNAHFERQATATGDAYRALVAVSAAIVSHRDLPKLFHEQAGLLPQGVCFDHLTLFPHDAASSAPMAAPAPPEQRFPRGASGLFPSSPRFALSATRYRPSPCEETHRRQLRRHGSCVRGVQGNAGHGVNDVPNHSPRQAGAPNVPARDEGTTMYQLSVYAITANLWRWEFRCGGALLRCGTAPTRVAAEMAVRDGINT
jgi:hypothetical protein